MIAVLALTLLAMPAGATTTDPTMLIKANDLAEIQAAGGKVSPTWVAYGTGGPASHLGTSVWTATSYVTLKNEYTDGILTRYQWVLLDMEPWRWTPKNEWDDLAHYEQLSAELVHSHGMKIMIAPFIIVGGLADDTAGTAARYADVVGIQAQPDDGDTATYKAFVDKAVAQARAANPEVQILAGIATDSGGVPITGRQMFDAYESVASEVDGYWLNAAKWSDGTGCAPNGCPGSAIDFLRLLQTD